LERGHYQLAGTVRIRKNYIEGGNFSNYINSKIKQKALPASFAQLVITAYNLGDDDGQEKN
jgi:hypothetical protein